MDLMSTKPSQTPTRLQKLSYYFLVGLIMTIGIYFLLQGIAQLW